MGVIDIAIENIRKQMRMNVQQIELNKKAIEKLLRQQVSLGKKQERIEEKTERILTLVKKRKEEGKL